MQKPTAGETQANKAARSGTAVAALGLLILLKLGLLLAFGPTFVPDTVGYAQYADAILAGRINDPDLLSGIYPVTLFRVIGYPAVIAAAKWTLHDAWPWGVVALQFAASLIATGAVYRLAGQFGFGRWGALGISAAQATSLPLVLDQSLATDSLYASILILAAGGLAGAVLDRRPPTFAESLGVGVALAVAFLLREATTLLAIGLLPLAVAAVRAGSSWRRAALLLLLMFVPLAVINQGYKEWNEARTGAAFVTTGSAINLVYALIMASRYDATIFSGDSALDRVAARTPLAYQPPDADRIAIALQQEYGLTAIAQSRDAFAAYGRAWLNHPAAMIRFTLGNLREWQPKLAVRPVDSIRDLILLSTGNDDDFGLEAAVTHGRWWMAPVVGARRLSEALAITLFAGFLLLTPWRVLQQRWEAPQVLAGAGLLMLYLATTALYAIVVLQPRYLAPVVPWPTVVGSANLMWLWRSRPNLLRRSVSVAE